VDPLRLKPSTPPPSSPIPPGLASPAPGPSSIGGINDKKPTRRQKKPRMSKNPKVKKPTTALEAFDAWYNNLPDIIHRGVNQSLINASELGQMPRTALRPYNSPPFGSRSAQRGSIGTAEVLQPRRTTSTTRPRRTAAPGGRTFTSSRRSPGARGTGPGARSAPRQVTASQLEEELSPIEVPQRERYTDLQPIEVPERERYTGLEPVEVPQRRKYGSSPAARPGAGAVSTGRVARTAGNPASSSLPGVGTAPRTRASAASIRIGAFELPLEPIVRALTTRKPAQRPRKASDPQPGVAPEPVLTPGSNPFEQVSYAYDYDKKCRCPKKKASKPRQPRTECRQGTYKQTARGVTYRPNKIVPCT